MTEALYCEIAEELERASMSSVSEARGEKVGAQSTAKELRGSSAPHHFDLAASLGAPCFEEGPPSGARAAAKAAVPLAGDMLFAASSRLGRHAAALQVGFGRGHAALSMLLGNPWLRLTCLPQGSAESAAAPAAAEVLRRRFPHAALTLVLGADWADLPSMSGKFALFHFQTAAPPPALAAATFAAFVTARLSAAFAAARLLSSHSAEHVAVLVTAGRETGSFAPNRFGLAASPGAPSAASPGAPSAASPGAPSAASPGAPSAADSIRTSELLVRLVEEADAEWPNRRLRSLYIGTTKLAVSWA